MIKAMRAIRRTNGNNEVSAKKRKQHKGNQSRS